MIIILAVVRILVSELFTEFYRHPHHGASARYLYFGVDGHRELVPCIWTSIGLSVGALLRVPGRRRTSPVLYVACAMLFYIQIDKGIGPLIPD